MPAPSSTPSRLIHVWRSWRPQDRRATLIAYTLRALWCFPLLFPLDARGAFGSDWEYFLAYFEAFRSTVINYLQFPGLNPWNDLGSPLWANPRIGPVSHTGLLVLIFGTLPGIKLGMALSTFFAFESARALGRRLFASPLAPIIAGLLYALNPALAAHLSRGQLCFGAYFLAPLLALFTLQMIERRPSGALAGLTAGLMVLYGVHYFVLYAWLFSALLALAVAIRHRAPWALARFGAPLPPRVLGGLRDAPHPGHRSPHGPPSRRPRRPRLACRAAPQSLGPPHRR